MFKKASSAAFRIFNKVDYSHPDAPIRFPIIWKITCCVVMLSQKPSNGNETYAGFDKPICSAVTFHGYVRFCGADGLDIAKE